MLALLEHARAKPQRAAEVGGTGDAAPIHVTVSLQVALKTDEQHYSLKSSTPGGYIQFASQSTSLHISSLSKRWRYRSQGCPRVPRESYLDLTTAPQSATLHDAHHGHVALLDSFGMGLTISLGTLQLLLEHRMAMLPATRWRHRGMQSYSRQDCVRPTISEPKPHSSVADIYWRAAQLAIACNPERFRYPLYLQLGVESESVDQVAQTAASMLHMKMMSTALTSWSTF